MTKLHWEERFEDRVMTLPLTFKEKIDIKMKVLEGQRTSRGDEGICIHIFEKEVINQDYKYHRRNENQLWMIVRQGIIKTVHRRSSEHNYSTTPEGMKVDRVRYSLN
jgi:hypothetical protein